MTIDADRRLTEGVAEQDISALTTDPRQAQEIRQVVRYLAAEASDQLVGAVVYRPGFGSVKVNFADFPL